MPTIVATPYPAAGRVLVQTQWSEPNAACVQVRRVITSTGESAPLRTYVWPCSEAGEYQHLSGGYASFWDTEAPLDEPFTYEATAVDGLGALVGLSDAYPGTTGGLIFSRYIGGSATTPDNAALDIASDIEVVIDLTPPDWKNGGAYSSLASKWDGSGLNQQSWIVQVTDGGFPAWVWSTTGADINQVFASAPVPFSPGERGALKYTFDANDGAGNRITRFYWAHTAAGPWTPLGNAAVTVGTTTIFNSTAVLRVGGHTGATDYSATVHSLTVRNGIGGTIVAQPNFYLQANRTASFTDAPGRLWTVNVPGYIAHNTEATLAVSSTVTLESDGDFWLRDPVRPCNDRRLQLCFDKSDPNCVPGEGIFFASMGPESYANNSYLALPTNARRPIAIARARRDANAALTVVTRTFPDRDAVLALNEPGSPLQFVAPPAYGIPDRYMTVNQVTVSPPTPDLRYQPRLIQMPFDTVDRPVGPTQGVCGARIQDLCDLYPTWDDFAASGLSYSTLIEGTPAALGQRTWGQVNSTFANWTAVLANGTWQDARDLP